MVGRKTHGKYPYTTLVVKPGSVPNRRHLRIFNPLHITSNSLLNTKHIYKYICFIGYLCDRGDEFRPKQPCKVASRPSRTREQTTEWPQCMNAIYDNGAIGTLT